MKTVVFTQNIGDLENLMRHFRLSEEIAKQITGKTVGQSVQVSGEVAARLKAVMPGAVEIS